MFGNEHLTDFEMSLGERVTVPVSKFSQVPNCDYAIEYSLTLIESPSASEPNNFSEALEGQSLFATLDAEKGTITFLPDSSAYYDKSFAVYITSHVDILEAEQAPVAATFGPFMVTIPAPKSFVQNNSAPFIAELVEDIQIVAGQEIT